MGEAKARGNFEERKKAAIERNEVKRIERLKKLAEIERNKTAQQKQREQETQMTLAQILGLAAPYFIINRRNHELLLPHHRKEI